MDEAEMAETVPEEESVVKEEELETMDTSTKAVEGAEPSSIAGNESISSEEQSSSFLSETPAEPVEDPNVSEPIVKKEEETEVIGEEHPPGEAGSREQSVTATG